MFRCRNCGLYAHADWTAAVIIRNRAFVQHCEWQHGYTPDVLTAPTGWREQPSGSGQASLGLELSVFKPEGPATSSSGSRVRGPRPDHRIQAAVPDAKSVEQSVSAGKHSRILPQKYPGPDFRVPCSIRQHAVVCIPGCEPEVCAIGRSMREFVDLSVPVRRRKHWGEDVGLFLPEK